MSNRAVIVIPTFQEAANIDEVLRRVRRAAPGVDVLLVDDNSPDGTANQAEATARVLGQIFVLRRPSKAGLGTAYRAGFARALEHGYDVVLQMDADLSHDPAAITTLLRGIAHGADLVIGSRYIAGGLIPGWSSRRRLLSRWGNRYAQIALGLGTADATSGFRAFRADALRTISYESTRATGYGFQIEVANRAARAGMKIIEVPIVFHDRARGASKMSARITGEALALVTWWAIRDRVLRRRGAELRQGIDVGAPATA